MRVDPVAALNIELGEVAVSNTWVRVPLTLTFTNPIVVAGPPGFNNADPCVVRLRNVNQTGFDIQVDYFREQERNSNRHVPETVNFIAWEPGSGTMGSVQYEVATTAKAVTDAWYTRSFTKTFNQPPMLLADMQTTNDTDPSALRVQQVSATDFQVMLEEEKSKSRNITHTAETVGYLGFDKVAK